MIGLQKMDSNSWDQLTSFDGLIQAASKAMKGKRRKGPATRFLQDLDWNVLALSDELRAKSYCPRPYREIHINDPKSRMVSAADFRDRVVHHALYAQIEPVFESGFVFDTYANRKGKGTHKAFDRFLGYAKLYRYVLRCDIYRYFPAIDHQVLKADVRRKIRCSNLLWLVDLIIDHSNPQEPVNMHFQGDGLLDPLGRRRGLPIGNLTSQFFGNVYLNPMDHFVKEVLRIPGYVRYVDDFALFSDNLGQMREAKARLDRFLAKRRLKLHGDKSYIAMCSEPFGFFGYERASNGSIRISDTSVKRLSAKVRLYKSQFGQDWDQDLQVISAVQGWTGHAKRANTWRLRHSIFKGSRFDPVNLLEAA